MADELNIPIHRWYEPRNNISLPNSDFSKQWIYDSGIQKIDRWINSQPWGNPIPGLFSSTAIGIWLDPSDVANLAWRRNLLTYSEQFDNAAWTKTRTTISANAITAPDGTSTADKLVEDTSTNDHWVGLGPDDVAGAAYTASVFAKAGERGFVALSWQFESPTFFNLTTGAIGTQNPNYTASITPLSDGWFRCSITRTAVSTSDFLKISVRNADGVASYTGDGTSGIYIWGAQFEAGSLTDYQRISDVNTEVIERFPTATMYQDAAGTTAVTTPGQPVGLRLDKSKGLALGAELETDTWSAVGAGITYDGAGTFTFDGVTSQSNIVFSTNTPAASIVAGQTYRVEFTIFASTSLPVGVDVGGSLGDAQSAAGTYVRYIVAANTTGPQVRFRTNSGARTGSMGNISVRELPGNHATQSVLASRPTYGIEPAGGRRNMLTFSEDFTNAVWLKSETTVPATQFLAPDGTTTAEALIPTTVSGQHYTYVSVTTAAAQHTISLYAKSNGYDFITLMDATVSQARTFNLSNGTKGGTAGQAAPVSDDIVSVGGGWYRCSITVSATAAAQSIRIYAYSADNPAGWSGNGTSGILIWGAQLELGSTATPYQRVTTAFDVTEAGVQTCHYVQYDGSDDGMITNSIDFTATDKMSVFAGVKKTTGNNNAVVIESSAAWPTNAGSFAVIANDGSIENYGAKANFTTLTSYRAPRTGSTTDVMSLAWDFSATSGELSTQLAMRLNGESQPVTGAGGTAAAFGNYKLNLGRRGNDQVTPTLPFFGRDYGIVVVGKATTPAEITSTESWLAGKTGFYAPIITGVPTIGVS